MGKTDRDRQTDLKMSCQRRPLQSQGLLQEQGCAAGEKLREPQQRESRAEAGREGPQLSFRAGVAGVAVSLE